MKAIESSGHQVYFESRLEALPGIIEKGKYSNVFVFADRNTSDHCLSIFREMMDDFSTFDLIETDPGEENKNIDFCIGIWKTLLDFGADRKCLLINLGGGVITDMGGFVASTYKRGIQFINIPTSLLSMVDASVGGKTGIDIDNVKNMVGTFSLPEAVFIETEFLKTLPERELLSGFAEMLKHGLISDQAYYHSLKNEDYKNISPGSVYRSVEIKNEVVQDDPLEKGRRKILNFGHTIGHAVESYSLSKDKKPLTHGEAIAIGMICEAHLSTKNSTLTLEELEEIKNTIISIFPKYKIKESSFSKLTSLMESDKKNEHGNMLFTLLEGIGKCTYNCRVTTADVLESMVYYNTVYNK